MASRGKSKRHRLSHKKLSRKVPESWTRWNTTADLSASTASVGQERALHAIEVGLQIPGRGFNLFAVGDPGAGKTSIVRRLLAERTRSEEVPPDLCYVASFKTPERPRPLLLPPGRGRELAKDMERVIRELITLIPRALSAGTFGHLRAGLMADARARVEALNARSAEEAERLGVRIQEEDGELTVIPLLNGEPIEADAYDELTAAKRRRIEKNMLAFQEHLERNSQGKRLLERRTQERLLEAEVRTIEPAVEQLFREVSRGYRGHEDVLSFLRDAQQHVLETHRELMSAEDNEGDEGAVVDEQTMLARHRSLRVNVVVDRGDERGAPVVTERLPTVENLAGYFEYATANGTLATDHLLIRAGALHRANGGYLLLQASDLFSQEGAWDCLKGALRHGEIRTEPPAGVGGEGRPRIAGAMKPQAVPLEVKVILVGSSEYYYALRQEDEDFPRLFKIKAEFDSSMSRTRENVQALARFFGQVCPEERYLPLHRTGFGRLLEHASRLAGHQERLSIERAQLLDVLAEASFHARNRRARAIRGRDVEQALQEHRRRNDAAEVKLSRLIREGIIFIRTQGAAVGQINGIALYDVGGVSFGLPMRITARTYAGQRGVVNIDREVELSGAIHDKGALILVGYLGGRYAQRQTLGLSASITFEQSYDEIDGDSASAAELYAMLSALSGFPVSQSLAVTGSVNQLGEVQPIGGVNEKIEGVFRLARRRGLTGDQGVLIPRANVRNLMLDGEVIDACRKGQFHIHAVTTVDEGIEVLTGLSAGRRREDGSWTPDSINDRVQRRLAELNTVVRAEGISTALDRKL